jgi:hypothetical protein
VSALYCCTDAEASEGYPEVLHTLGCAHRRAGDTYPCGLTKGHEEPCWIPEAYRDCPAPEAAVTTAGGAPEESEGSTPARPIAVDALAAYLCDDDPSPCPDHVSMAGRALRFLANASLLQVEPCVEPTGFVATPLAPDDRTSVWHPRPGDTITQTLIDRIKRQEFERGVSEGRRQAAAEVRSFRDSAFTDRSGARAVLDEVLDRLGAGDG